MASAAQTFPLVTEGYDQASVDAAFEAERMWRRTLEDRASKLLAEAAQLLSALATGPEAAAIPAAVPSAPLAPAPAKPAATAAKPAPRRRAVAKPAPVAAEVVAADVEAADAELKARQAAEKREAAAAKRRAARAAKKQAETLAIVPEPAPEPAVATSPGAAWARRTAGVTPLRPTTTIAKPSIAGTRAVPSPAALPLALATAPLAPKGAAKSTKKRPVGVQSSVFGPMAVMGPLPVTSASGAPTVSRVIRIGQ